MISQRRWSCRESSTAASIEWNCDNPAASSKAGHTTLSSGIDADICGPGSRSGEYAGSCRAPPVDQTGQFRGSGQPKAGPSNGRRKIRRPQQAQFVNTACDAIIIGTAVATDERFIPIARMTHQLDPGSL